MKTPIAPIRLWAGIVLIALQALLAGCSSTKQIEWKEEVLLQTGEKIMVERELVLREHFELSQGRNWVPYLYTIRFTHSSLLGGSVKWSYDETPMILDYDPRTHRFYIVVTIPHCAKYRELGSPVPPYLVFELVNGEWQRTAFKSELSGREANLLITDELQEAGEKISIKKKTEINAQPGLVEYLRKVIPDYPVTC